MTLNRNVLCFFSWAVVGSLVGCGSGSGPGGGGPGGGGPGGGGTATTPVYAITSPEDEAENVDVPVAFEGTGPTSHDNVMGAPKLWVAEYDLESESYTNAKFKEFSVTANGTWSATVDGLNSATDHAAVIGQESSMQSGLDAYTTGSNYTGPAEVSPVVTFVTAEAE